MAPPGIAGGTGDSLGWLLQPCWLPGMGVWYRRGGIGGDRVGSGGIGWSGIPRNRAGIIRNTGNHHRESSPGMGVPLSPVAPGADPEVDPGDGAAGKAWEWPRGALP